MADLLLINPAKPLRSRRQARKGSSVKKRRSGARRRNPSPAQRAARARFAAAARSRSRAARASNPRRRRRRRANPAPAIVRRVTRRMTRRANPVGRRHRRRRNPISLGSTSSYIAMLKEAFIGGAGAVAVDVGYGYLAGYLPPTLQRVPGQVGLGDAVKALITIIAGKVLDRPTRGLSVKAAKGSLIVQAHGLIAQMLPSTMTLGYAVAAPVSNMNTRIGPNRRMLNASGAMGRYTVPGRTQMLGAYTAPGITQMLATRRPVASTASPRPR